MPRFNPNEKAFADCVARVEEAAKKFQQPTGVIVTSKDRRANEVREELRVTNIPEGFSKWQLPVYFKKPTHLFISVGSPGVHTPEHSHDEGDGLRFIASGSISYDGKELGAGDWMFIPAGAKYEFTVGSLGATMFYCYECCCA